MDDVLTLERPKTQVRFQWEPLRVLLKEPNINDLLNEHWRELGVHQTKMPLDPDYARMIAAEDMGYFKVWTARDGKTLVGYMAFFIQPHLHFKSTITAVEDLYLLTASHRKGMTGYRMFVTAIDALKAHGAQRLYLHCKVHFEKDRGGLGQMFERLGFVHTDNYYSKIL